MALHLNKPALRILGIAESFKKSDNVSHLAGIVMRGDFRIDGVSFSKITVGGEDATEGVFRIFREMDRADINVIFTNGAVISWFNIIDLQAIYERLSIPVVCISYKESPGLEKFIHDYFPNNEEKMQRYYRLGQRKLVRLKTGYEIYIRVLGASCEEARILLNKFTLDGRVPEPLRVARLSARAALHADQRNNSQKDE
ncbi:MAG: DUF99 family protein [Methanotrichaceae archaeon]|nr:DUF99 family protein [Methanotrichaceae archaeon]